jgi:hypothetical protein
MRANARNETLGLGRLGPPRAGIVADDRVDEEIVETRGYST